MDHILLQSMMPRRTSRIQTQLPVFRDSPRQQIPSGQMVTFSYSLLNRYGNHWKYFDDNRYLPRYFETDPSKDTPTHNIEVAVQAHHRTVLDGRCNPLFEAVQFTLHCAIMTQVGKHAASQKVSSNSAQRHPQLYRSTRANMDPWHRFYNVLKDVGGQTLHHIRTTTTETKALLILLAA